VTVRREGEEIRAALHRAHDVIGLLETDVDRAADELLLLLHRGADDPHVHGDAFTLEKSERLRHVQRPRVGAFGNQPEPDRGRGRKTGHGNARETGLRVALMLAGNSRWTTVFEIHIFCG
jgi:hypothetical protein